jgi:putative tributyrin esterase
MAHIHCSFYSKALGFRTSIEVYLPQPDGDSPDWSVARLSQKIPVLYFLPGFTNDESEFTRHSKIGRSIEEYLVALVIPAVHRTVYVDIGKTHRYFTYLTEELPALVQSFFPISSRREDTCVAGLSMGGYGAIKIGLTLPERYAAAASLAGVLDYAQAASTQPFWAEDRRFNFGDQHNLVGGPHDVFHLARCLAAADGPKPRLYAIAGTEDFVYEGNQAFHSLAASLGLDYTFEDGPGRHDWDDFDPLLDRLMAWFNFEKHGS